MNIKKLKTTNKFLFTMLPIVGIILVMYLMKYIGAPELLMNLFFVITGLIYMSYWWKDNSESRWELLIIGLAVITRILVCSLDVYGGESIDIPLAGGDSIAYLRVSKALYYGTPDKFYTYYPYVVNGIFQITGPNQFAAQFVNILCWCISTLLIQKSCKLLNIEGKLRTAAIFLYSFAPVNLIYSSILMREALSALAILLTFYCILRWMKDGDYLPLIAGVLVAAPGFLMHNSLIGLWGILGLVLVFFSPSSQKFCVGKRTLYMMSAVIAAAAIVVISLKAGILQIQIPDFRQGIFNAINGRLYYFFDNVGGSTYLLNEYVYDYPSLIVGTIKRMLYFLCSPVPFMWRGGSDLVAFFGSTIIYIFCVIVTIISMFCKKKDPYRLTMFLTVIVVCLIFAWMVSNGGTAMRHREKFLGVFLLLGVYSCKLIKDRFEKKNLGDHNEFNC